MKIQPFFVFLNKRIYRPSFASDGLKRSCLQAQTIFKSRSSKWRESKQEDGEAVLAGVYENLNAVNANPQESFLYYACLASDDQLGGGGTNDKLMQAEDLLCNYNADMTNNFYMQRYEGMTRANTLIQALPNTALDDKLKAQYLGEAKVLRAFYYYELSSMYGNVPLRTEPGGETIKQGKIEDVWKQILQDLYEASTTMPSERKTDGHVDKYTAEGMLARAWLFYTGFFCNGTTIADEVSSTYKPLTEVELPNGTKLTKQMVIDLVDDCVNNSVHHRGLSLSKTGNNISIPALQIHGENSYLCTGK